MGHFNTTGPVFGSSAPQPLTQGSRALKRHSRVSGPTLRDHMHIHTPGFGVGWPRLASEVNDVHEQLTDLELRPPPFCQYH